MKKTHLVGEMALIRFPPIMCAEPFPPSEHFLVARHERGLTLGFFFAPEGQGVPEKIRHVPYAGRPFVVRGRVDTSGIPGPSGGILCPEADFSIF